jgi:hypothetical protein
MRGAHDDDPTGNQAMKNNEHIVGRRIKHLHFMKFSPRRY